jgi:hypothetical protein
MLSTTIIKTTHTRFLINSSTRLFHIFNGKYNPDYQRLGKASYERKNIISPALQCRLIQPDEFTNEFEDLVFRRFILEEPMTKHLGVTEPDECIMLFLRQILQRAKKDRVSLGIYNNNQQYTNEVNVRMSNISFINLNKTFYFNLYF